MDFQVYMVLLLIPISLLHYHVHAEGIKSRCESPATYMGDTGSVTCYFSVDLKQSSKNFRLYRYSVDPTNIRTRDELVVLECYWLTVGNMKCEPLALGYEFNGTVSDQVRVTIPKASPDFQGKYECRAEPSYPRDIKDCVFLIKKSEKDSSKTAVIVVGVVVPILLAAVAIVLVVFRKRVKDRLSCCGRQTTTGRSPPEQTPGETGTPLLASHAKEQSTVTERPEGHSSTVNGESEDKRLDRQNNETDESDSRERRRGKDFKPASGTVTSGATPHSRNLSLCRPDGSYRILLVGRRSRGISLTGNAILGEEKSRVRLDGAAHGTKPCQLERGQRLGRTVEIMNTPGLFDPDRSAAEVFEEIKRSVKKLSPSFHVVLWVVQISRYSEEEHHLYKLMKHFLGKDVTKHTIVLSTRADFLGHDAVTFEKRLEESPQNLRQVLGECGNRYVYFNNDAEGAANDKQLENLFSVIDKLLAQNGGKIYRPTLNVKDSTRRRCLIKKAATEEN